MILQDQVCSLGRAIKLRAAGINQSGYFLIDKDFNIVEQWTIDGDEAEFFCAFTVAELGIMIPSHITIDGYYRTHFSQVKQDQQNKDAIHDVTFGKSSDKEIPSFVSIKEADARADLILFLLEAKFITPAQVNAALDQLPY